MLNLRKLIARTGILALAAGSAACTSISFFIANVPASFGPHHRTADIAYGSDKRQKLDVYVPADTGTGGRAQGRPVVIFWYGGSWQTGSKSAYRFVGAALAERGFVTVLPDYRLYPKVKFPLFLDDAAQAVAWVQQHAQEFGGDPRHIVLMGHSAGAHTAAFLALRPDVLAKAGARPEWIAGLVGLAGPYALAPNTRALHTIFSKPYVEADWQPVRFVTSKAPPTFLAHGLDDFLVSPRQTEQLRDALRRADVRVETELYPDRGHVDMVAAFAVPVRHRVPVLEDAAKFIESVTSVAPASSDVPSSAQLTGAR
jgi:acetyl esterase/lipase